MVVANSKQKVFSRTHKVVKYTPKNFGYDYTLYCMLPTIWKRKEGWAKFSVSRH